MNKPFATVLDSATSLKNKTGSWRTMRPEYVTMLPPCNATCPAGENIQQWLSLAQEGKFREAWEVMVKDNPFPATMGRVCYHTCERVCNRDQFDGAVNINLIERSIGDIAIANGWQFESVPETKNKKILIIGGGPSGLTAAYFLRKLGYGVAIYESHIKLGGMMRYGVPRYRLPGDVMDSEIRRIIDMGVSVVCNRMVSDIKTEARDFDAVYIAIGAYQAIKASLNVQEGSNTIDAVELLRKLEDYPSSLPTLGKKVIVYGGGNTAIDAARTVLRLGAESVKIVYRRTINNLSAHDTEIHEALEEGIEILCLRTINTVEKGKVLLDIMNYDEENDILSKTEQTDSLPADSVIFAVGQSLDKEILKGTKEISISEHGVIEIDRNMMTGAEGIFAGGDAIMGKRTVTHAIGAGKKAAKCIDAYLQGLEPSVNIKNPAATFKRLNTAYFPQNPRVNVSRLGDISFEEKNISYFDQEIVDEASRCFSCGNCFHCDNCYGYCPDNAIIKYPDGSLEINLDYCKGCGMCVAECPCGSMKMTLDE
ncbi:MAG: FAD-dependent oxidoreductase [Holosporaceae bacterium]|jgi:NADPH-dependent glutamate synthase beta subunit-like oxidoreductase/NAD-dependent dihydropyrimidine dehydrogenase PreA subunit|nr:FAD-dependent oxidoreductase [Holosporaceae bacterium]